VRDARKRFGQVEALRGASLALRPGELLGLLGPNGAGKTTLIRAITGRVRLDAGTVALRDAAGGARAPLGVVPQELALYPLLTARENLRAFGELNGVAGAVLRERVDAALQWSGLGDRADQIVRGFSGGMKRRLNLACGVLHEPPVVLLDEPTVGVDPQSRERLYDMLASLRARGTSLLLTTHQLDEAESRCDRVAVLDHGVVIATGTVPELVARTVGAGREIVLTLDRALATPLEGTRASDDGRRLTARGADVGELLARLIQLVRAAGAHVEDVEVRRPGLHAAFLHLTGKDLRE
jgi:ABC-2 type transport system ATP-binding protein